MIEDRPSTLVHFWRLKIPKGQVYFFFYCYLGVALVAGITPFTEPQEFKHPISALIAGSPLKVWAVTWLIIWASTVAFCFSRRYVWYVLANCLALFRALVRTFALTQAKFIEDVDVTSEAIVLWSLIAVNAFYALTRTNVVRYCPKFRPNG